MKKTFIALFLIAFIGLAASLSLTRLHFKIAAEGFQEKSFCHISEFIDCDTVVASRYSFLGPVPTSELGIIFYALLLIGLLYSCFLSKMEDRRPTLAFLFAATLFAFVDSVAMAYLSFFKLGVLCLLCGTTYAANFLMLLLFPKALEIRYSRVPGFFVRYVKSLWGRGEFKPRLLFHLGTTLIVAALGLLFFRGLNPEMHRIRAEIPREAYLKFFHSLPQESIDVTGHPFWGFKDAKVTIVEFSDFQCPHCRRAAFTLKPYLKEFRNSIRFVYFNYPLDSACNPAMQHPVHPVSCLAAKAALCAEAEGRFWEYHDKIFENQKRLSRATLLTLAEETGLDASRFESCLVSDKIAQALQQDVEEGARLKIQGTPTVFVNGRPLRDWGDPDVFRMVIEAELQAK